MKNLFVFLICLFIPVFGTVGSESKNKVNYVVSSADEISSDLLHTVPSGTICLTACDDNRNNYILRVTGDIPPASLYIFIDGVNTGGTVSLGSSFFISRSLYPTSLVTLAYPTGGFWGLYAVFQLNPCYCDCLEFMDEVCYPNYCVC